MTVGILQKRWYRLLALLLLLLLPGPTAWQSIVTVSAASTGWRRAQPANQNLTTANSINEVEPNNSPEQATPLNLTLQQVTVVSGQVPLPGTDLDFYSFTAPAGAKVWAYVDSGGQLMNQDSKLVLLNSDGITEIETDDDDGTGNGCDSSIESRLASVIAGRTLPDPSGSRTFYLRVSSFGVLEYKLYVIVTNTAAPAEEEPNNALTTANVIIPATPPDLQFGLRAGAIGSDSDADIFSFQATAGEILMVNADGDPERDGTFINLVVDLLGPNGTPLFTADNGIGTEENSPAEGFCFALSTSGTHYLRVRGSQNSTGTYQLMVARAGSQTNTITSLSPNSVNAGGGAFTLTVNGTSFAPNAVVHLNGAPRMTAFLSAAQLTAQILAADIATAGTANITVVTPGQGGGTSNTAILFINNPAPTITSLSPIVVPVAGPAFTLTVNGTNFINGSVVRFNGQVRPTTFSSSTQLTALIPATDLTNVGIALITVFTPAPGGGISNELPLAVGIPEADVSPRPDGNGFVSIADWVQVGRFYSGVDSATTGNEYQRADCAPRETRGNGLLDLADWVQAGRYAAGMDALQPAGGPAAPMAGLQARGEVAINATRGARLRRFDRDLSRGERTSSVAIEFDAQGDENAIAFSLAFDPATSRFISATLGAGMRAAYLNVNAREAARGRVGLALAFPVGQTLTPGAHQLIVLTFAARSTGATTAAPSFGDFPIVRQVVNAEAATVPATWGGAGRRARRY